jgi:hypothetical protein
MQFKGERSTPAWLVDILVEAEVQAKRDSLFGGVMETWPEVSLEGYRKKLRSPLNQVFKACLQN